MTKRISLELTDEEFTQLWHKAVREITFMRAYPNRAWTDTERREAIQLYVKGLANG